MAKYSLDKRFENEFMRLDWTLDITALSSSIDAHHFVEIDVVSLSFTLNIFTFLFLQIQCCWCHRIPECNNRCLRGLSTR